MNKGDSFNSRYLVDESVYKGFIELFKDQNPLHTDAEFAAEKGFSGKVMHGNILNGFLSHFVGEGLPSKDVIIQTQQIQYSLPVYLGDELVLHAHVADVFESVKSVEIKFFFQNKLGKKVAKGTIQIGLLT